MQRLSCFVDESGQHTVTRTDHERIFVVAVAVFKQDRNVLEQACERYEKISGKGKRKWNAGSREGKLAYMQLVMDDARFIKALCYSPTRAFRDADFDLLTITGIAKAIQVKRANADSDYFSDVFADGISETKQVEYARELRRLGISVRRVHRARDESYALIRLADALAGLAREAEEGAEESAKLLHKAIRRGVVVEV